MVKKLLFYKLLKHQQDLIYIWRHFEGLVFLFTGILECNSQWIDVYIQNRDILILENYFRKKSANPKKKKRLFGYLPYSFAFKSILKRLKSMRLFKLGNFQVRCMKLPKQLQRKLESLFS